MEKPPNESQTVFYRLTEIHLGIRQVLSKVLFPVIIILTAALGKPTLNDELVDELQVMISERNKELHDERGFAEVAGNDFSGTRNLTMSVQGIQFREDLRSTKVNLLTLSD